MMVLTMLCFAHQLQTEPDSTQHQMTAHAHAKKQGQIVNTQGYMVPAAGHKG